jgi:hypothetical protein
MMRTKQLLRLVIAFGFVIAAPQLLTAQGFAIEKSGDEHIEISYNEQPVIRLMIANDEDRAHETYKVFTHVMDPLDPEGKRTLTKGPHGKYTHHRGIFFGMSDAKVEGIGKYDFWHMKNVRQEFQKVLMKKASSNKATVAVRIHWVVGDEMFLAEKRSVTVHKPTSNGRVTIDHASQVLATEGKTVLKGDPEHGGYQFRASQAVAENNSAEYLYPKGISKSDVKDGTTIPWAAQTFKMKGNRYHVLHMAHPSLPDKNNKYSAYRPYGRFGVYFEDTLEKGETATYRIRLTIGPGGFPDQNPIQKMQKAYEQYVQSTN